MTGRPRAVFDAKEFQRLYLAGYPDGAIAERLAFSRPTVVRIRRQLGLAPNRYRGQRGRGKKKAALG